MLCDQLVWEVIAEGCRRHAQWRMRCVAAAVWEIAGLQVDRVHWPSAKARAQRLQASAQHQRSRPPEGGSCVPSGFAENVL